MLNKYMFSQKHHDSLSTQKEMTMQSFSQMFKSYNNICDMFYRMENLANIYYISLSKSFSLSKPKKNLTFLPLLLLFITFDYGGLLMTILFTLVGANNGDGICMFGITYQFGEAKKCNFYKNYRCLIVFDKFIANINTY
jgi:hypothetical protein